MTASKNCQCPVCNERALVKTSGDRWYFVCDKCKTLIGVFGQRISIRADHGITHTLIEHMGKWRTAKEAIKAIKEYISA